MIAVTLGMASALGYGLSDYFAGPASRRFPAVLLVFFSQVAQAIILIVVLLASSGRMEVGSLAWGSAAGVLNATALIAYYEALGRGAMSVVAPIASTGAVLPVVVGLLGGNTTSAMVIAGLAIVLIGIVLVAASRDGDESCSSAPCRGAMAPMRRQRSAHRPSRVPLFLAIIAAGAFGSYFLLVDRGATGGTTSALWTAEGVQLGAMATTAAVVVVRRVRWALPGGSTARVLAVITILNLLGDLALISAVGRGNVAIVSVLTSLAPVVTVLLSLVLLKERPSRQQGLGAGLAMIGTIIISVSQ